MGFYDMRIFPWIMDKMMQDPVLLPLRGEALAPARGRVLEIGFGSGVNLRCYPQDIGEIVALEPSRGMIRKANERIARGTVRTEVLEGVAERIPAADRSFDTVVSTCTLCSVAELDRSLAEIRRVLVPGGRFLLLEHGLSPDPKVQKIQNLLNPLQRVLGAGCNLNRDIGPAVERAGFRFEAKRSFYMEKAPRPFGWVTLGAAEPV